MRRRAFVLPMAITAGLLLAQQACAEMFGAAILIPIVTPTCPSFIGGVEAAAVTAATGVDELYVDVTTVQARLSGPGYVVTTIPLIMSQTVSSEINGIVWGPYVRNPAEHGPHVLTTTHQWILELVGTVITSYDNGFVFVDRP